MNSEPQSKETKTYILSTVATILGVVCSLIVSTNIILGRMMEITSLQSELDTLKRDYEKLKGDNEHIYQLAVGVWKEGRCSIENLQPFFKETYKQDRQQLTSLRAEVMQDQSKPLYDNLVHGPLITTKPLN